MFKTFTIEIYGGYSSTVIRSTIIERKGERLGDISTFEATRCTVMVRERVSYYIALRSSRDGIALTKPESISSALT